MRPFGIEILNIRKKSLSTFLPFCEISSPPLSTIRVFKQEMGQMAVKRLLDKIKSQSKIVSKIQIGTEYIERESVKAPIKK